MPPVLHPRSNYTTSLFATTLAVAFLVVGLPHILPCPVPAGQYADARSQHLQQIQQKQLRKSGSGTVNAHDTSINIPKSSSALKPRPDRECPVPKPQGILGRVLGFEHTKPDQPVVKHESVRPKPRKIIDELEK